MSRRNHEISKHPAQRPLFLCCWCDVAFHDGERAVGHAENYGICPRCLEKALAELKSEPLARSA